MALPDFLLVGVPKAGTTALHVALARHQQLFLSAVKEPKFFLADRHVAARAGGPRREDVPGSTSGAARTTRRSSPGRRRGRCVASRRRSTCATRRRTGGSRRCCRPCGVVAVVRDPVDRAHSNWTHLRSAGREPEPDFVRACGLESERAERGWAPFWRYVELGRYGEQLQHLLSVFPREQVHVVLYRDLRSTPRTLDRIWSASGWPPVW